MFANNPQLFHVDSTFRTSIQGFIIIMTRFQFGLPLPFASSLTLRHPVVPPPRSFNLKLPVSHRLFYLILNIFSSFLPPLAVNPLCFISILYFLPAAALKCISDSTTPAGTALSLTSARPSLPTVRSSSRPPVFYFIFPATTV